MSLDLSNIQLKDIKYILAVYRMLSFRKASKVCGVSQATISGQVFKLERILNLKLIERNSRNVEFTTAGKVVVEQLNRINDEFKVLSEIAFSEQKKNPVVTGEFNIGIIPTVSPFFIDCLYQKLKSRFKKYNFNIVELTTDRILEEFNYNNIDLAIASNHPSLETDKIKKVKFGDDELVFLMHDQNENLTEDPISPIDIINSKVFLLNDGNCLRDQALSVCFKHLQDSYGGNLVDIRYGATSVDTLKSIVANNIGVSIIPAMSLHQPMPNNVAVCPIMGKPNRELFLIFGQDSLNEDFYNRFATELKKIFTIEYKKLKLSDKFYKKNY